MGEFGEGCQIPKMGHLGDAVVGKREMFQLGELSEVVEAGDEVVRQIQSPNQ